VIRRSAWLPLLLLLAGCSAGAPTTTEQGQEFRDLWSLFLVIAVLVVALIWGLVAWCVIRYRHRPEDGSLPNQDGDRPKLELTYTVIPLVVVAVLFTLSVVAERRVDEVSDDPDLTVVVEAYRWDWRFTYLVDGPDVEVIGGDERPVLVLPVDRTIRFDLRTADVIHSFWVPEFGTKRDMIPRVDNQIDIDITEPGTWTGRCAEYCGLDHASMDFEVRAVGADEFDQWLADQPTDGDTEAA
jgi:cytochrome c oxidase subunit 2